MVKAALFYYLLILFCFALRFLLLLVYYVGTTSTMTRMNEIKATMWTIKIRETETVAWRLWQRSGMETMEDIDLWRNLCGDLGSLVECELTR